jgi:hypothetical protein
MSVKILYFASLKEALGMGGESVELPAGVTPLAPCVTGWSRRAAKNWPAPKICAAQSIRTWPGSMRRSGKATKSPSSRRLPAVKQEI